MLELIGDGTLAIFTATDRTHARSAALSAATAVREGIGRLNKRRLEVGKLSVKFLWQHSEAASGWTLPSQVQL